jgi:hypothetical protein
MVLIFGGIAAVVLSVIAISVAVILNDSRPWGYAAIGLVLAGTVIMLAGILVAGGTLVRSADAIRYAVERTGRLPNM